MNDYKKFLNLPHTTFSMRGNLSKKEPEILKDWYKNNLYQLIRKKKENKKIFFLHDGPPYANGNIHIGHAVNKILKDIIIKSKNLSGFDAPYIPSWDCHGLPIEQKVELLLNKKKEKISLLEFQKECREYAQKQVSKQKEDFIRLGVIGDWNNPHLTMDFKNEAQIIRTLAAIINKKQLYRGFKPIHWCLVCRSSLSEAEVEYNTKKSDSIIVALKSNENTILKKIFNINILNKKIYLPIWTTTPWTLPASQAISIHPEFIYQLIETDKYCLILVKELVKKILNTLEINEWKILNEIKGEKLENIKFLHPFLKNIYLPIILGNHVDLETGTGAVHTAPDHGVDDYIICQKYNITPINIINGKGDYTKNIHEKLNNINILQANTIIIQLLKNHNALLHHEYITHNYPHCWRHKNPIIFRATPQWFISIDKKKLRLKSFQEVQNVLWIPRWGGVRISEMIKNRPDWCISRQRKWGVPMCIFIHKKTGEIHPNTIYLMEKIAQQVELLGIQAWWKLDLKQILGEDHKKYDKSEDILDVWFDSGNTHTSIQYQNKKYITNHANMYLEGSDQHRGWFMSSLIISTLIQGRAPYNEVLTHGFVVDKKGEKMSKSIGNTISPNNIVNTLGADVLRLWVASSNYSGDISISDDILKRSSDIYRRIRNTARFMLSNIYDFQPKKHIVLEKDMIYLDKWAISQTKMIQDKIIEFYQNYNFHSIVKRIMYFCSIEMGSFYLDIIKDRQYTLKKNSIERRSCQTAMYYILNALVRWISPILSFTANEIWSHLPNNNSPYVFTEEWFDQLFCLNNHTDFNHTVWNTLIELKNEVNKYLEEEKKNKNINNTLEASITIYVHNNLEKILNLFEKELKFIFLTSNIIVKKYEEAPINAKKNITTLQFKIVIKKIQGQKCPRCWHYNVIPDKQLKNFYICSRCLLNTVGNGEKRKFL
ncbi:isoleucine--tRNA ligase [Buchnera aphidicola]|uniref:isoleucine--tRNA ligase n=1 Tax=Buchnera aphidicola TaxID=9 RepID=UPI003BEF0EB3